MERCIMFQAACTNYVDRAVNMYFIRKREVVRRYTIGIGYTMNRPWTFISREDRMESPSSVQAEF